MRVAARAALLLEPRDLLPAARPQLLDELVSNGLRVLLVVAHFERVAAVHARHELVKHLLLVQNIGDVLHEVLALIQHHCVEVFVESAVEQGAELPVNLHTSAYVSIRQHTSAYAVERGAELRINREALVAEEALDELC